MSLGLNRGDGSVMARWWCTADRISLFAIGGLILCGALLILTATPPVAERLNLDHLHFARRQLILMPLAAVIVIALSMASLETLKALAVGLFLLALTGTVAAGFLGPEIKGARRWLPLSGFSIQPSEFLKPTFAVVAAWALQHNLHARGQPLGLPGATLLAIVLAALISQPDFGMSMLIVAGWTAQFFVAGPAWPGLIAVLIIGVLGVFAAYHSLPHVTARIDGFLNPGTGDNYQVQTSMESFRSGGLFGRGPGEGVVKQHLPDAHADFIFAVAGEEFGFLFCLAIILLYLVIVMRGFSGAMRQTDPFVMLAATGLLTQIGLQALVNMGSALRLIPAKGMTLPFISYGGSSLLATAITFGLLMGFTRQRFGGEDWR